MELVVLLLVISLLLSCEAGPTPLFVKKGEDALLSVTKTEGLGDFFFVEWNFNKNNFLVRFSPGKDPSVSSLYSGRTEFPEELYSVKLKNLQDSDSGVYTARLAGAVSDQILAEYNVTVQDPVSPVKLSVDSVLRNSDSCNVTVSCRTQDSHINSSIRCDTQSCSQDGGEQSKVTTSGAFLQVHLYNDSIICNHSNQVSWTEDMKIIQHFCGPHVYPPEPPSSITIPVVVGVTIVLFAIIIIIIIPVTVWCWLKRRNSVSQNIENTVYEVPQVEMTPQHLNQNPTGDASAQSQNSTYCLVGQHTGPVGSTETRGQNQPESLYAQVDKPRTVKK